MGSWTVVSLLVLSSLSYLVLSYRFVESEYWACSKDKVLCEDYNDYLLNCSRKQSCDSVRNHRAVYQDCVWKKQICDGQEDCRDGSDEKYCPYTFKYTGNLLKYNSSGCPTGYVNCKTPYFIDGREMCISKQDLCNGRDECSDRSDEDFCPLEKSVAPERKAFIKSYPLIQKNCSDQFLVQCEGSLTEKIGTMECIRNEFICDNDQDCSDGSDERYCPHDFDFSSPITSKPGPVTEGPSSTVTQVSLETVTQVSPDTVTQVSSDTVTQATPVTVTQVSPDTSTQATPVAVTQVTSAAVGVVHGLLTIRTTVFIVHNVIYNNVTNNTNKG